MSDIQEEQKRLYKRAEENDNLINKTRLNPREIQILLLEKDKEIERLNNIIKPKEVNYNYLKLLFEKKDKEEVIKSYVYKCEQLEKLYKSYEEKEIEVMKKDNIIDELSKWLKEENYKNEDFWCINSVEVLNKLNELKGDNK